MALVARSIATHNAGPTTSRPTKVGQTRVNSSGPASIPPTAPASAATAAAHRPARTFDPVKTSNSGLRRILRIASGRSRMEKSSSQLSSLLDLPIDLFPLAPDAAVE